MTGRAAGRTEVAVPRPEPSAPSAGTAPGAGLRVVAILEVAAAVAAVAADWFIPSLVLSAMAALSLLLRRASPSTLGFRRPQRVRRLAGQMLAWAAVLALVDIGVLIPVANHISGQRQDMSGFADLQGNVAMLAVFLVLGWTLAAFVEELAFRGYLFTRLTEVLGNSRWGVVAALVASSCLFGVIHTEQGWVGMVVAATDALFFGVLRVWKGTLWAPILAHGFDDTIGFVAFFLVGPVYGLW
jgi:membrane protease YdiL (CAAX protease family)